MTDWEKLAWVKRSKQRQKILKLLSSPKTPTDVADELEIQVSGASRSMRNMEDKELVKVLNPEDKLGRLYVVTDDGRDVLKELVSGG